MDYRKSVIMIIRTIFIILFSFIVLKADTTNTSLKYKKGGVLTGGRSKESIMRVVMQNLPTLRHAYNKRLKTNRNLFGKIIIKFAIDEFGEIIYSRVVRSTCKDSVFDNQINDLVSKWRFEENHKPGDVTVVVYPFVFVSNQSKFDVWALDIEIDKIGTRNAKKIARKLLRNEYKFLNIFCDHLNHIKTNFRLRITVDYKGNVVNIRPIEITKNDEIKNMIIETIKNYNFRRDWSSKQNTEFTYDFILNETKCNRKERVLYR